MATQDSTAVRAVSSVTNSTLLTNIARQSLKIDDLGFKRNSGVDTIELAATILNNREMSKIVEWFTGPNLEAGEIAAVLGSIIAASRNAARA